MINLIIKALLFSKSHKAFKDKLPTVQALKVASYNLWLKQGPVGKLYNLMTWINQLDYLTQYFLRRQKDYTAKNPFKKYKVYHIIINNATQWLLTILYNQISPKAEGDSQGLIG